MSHIGAINIEYDSKFPQKRAHTMIQKDGKQFDSESSISFHGDPPAHSVSPTRCRLCRPRSLRTDRGGPGRSPYTRPARGDRCRLGYGCLTRPSGDSPRC